MMARSTPVRQVRNMRHVVDLFNNRKTLTQMLKAVFNGQYRMSMLSNMAVVLGVLYVLVPFDIITDLIPFFGWADDGFVIYMVVKRLKTETMRFNRFKAMERRGF